MSVFLDRTSLYGQYLLVKFGLGVISGEDRNQCCSGGHFFSAVDNHVIFFLCILKIRMYKYTRRFLKLCSCFLRSKNRLSMAVTLGMFLNLKFEFQKMQKKYVSTPSILVCDVVDNSIIEY